MVGSATRSAGTWWGTSCTGTTATCPWPSRAPTARSLPPRISLAERRRRGRRPRAPTCPIAAATSSGDTVIHRVELSLFPNWVGVAQERLVEVKGNRLTLSTRPILLGGVRQTAHLIWEAVGTSEQ